MWLTHPTILSLIGHKIWYYLVFKIGYFLPPPPSPLSPVVHDSKNFPCTRKNATYTLLQNFIPEIHRCISAVRCEQRNAVYMSTCRFVYWTCECAWFLPFCFVFCFLFLNQSFYRKRFLLYNIAPDCIALFSGPLIYWFSMPLYPVCITS